MSSNAKEQRSVQEPISCGGVGLHSGKNVRLTLRPAPADHGVVFVRTDLTTPVAVPALSQYVVDTQLATTLGKGSVRVGTVEHLLAAVAGMGIDNLRVELDGPEVPIMDGSAAPFAELIRSAGLWSQSAPKRSLVIKKAVSVRDGDKEATLLPAARFRIDCTVDFRHPLISDQSYQFELSDRAFSKDLSRARTFGFLRDVEQLKKLGLAKGGSLENAVVVDEFSILNPEGLRFADEFARHKALDALGDLSLLGHAVVGQLRVYKSGHALNHQLVQKVLSDPSCYELVSEVKPETERHELRLDIGGLEPVAA